MPRTGWTEGAKTLAVANNPRSLELGFQHAVDGVLHDAVHLAGDVRQQHLHEVVAEQLRAVGRSQPVRCLVRR